ncbi:MAG: methyltransferase domain-containing protein, partial [Nanoarchaeota archaeon]|nr:methyltransferase domain-containing protein [Nanoarchaeota archaeon]
MHESIYEPREDSLLLAKYVSLLARKGQIVLDMGSGSGIQAEAAIQKGAKAVCVDINPHAVEHLKSKFMSSVVLQSDLFENVPE